MDATIYRKMKMSMGLKIPGATPHESILDSRIRVCLWPDPEQLPTKILAIAREKREVSLARNKPREDEVFVDVQRRFWLFHSRSSCCKAWVYTVKWFNKDHGEEGAYCGNCAKDVPS